jgi:hypothetical protein
MEGIELASGVVFDATDEEGRIIHTITGECLALDRIATILLQACLLQASRDEALAYVQARIDASNEQVEEGLQAVIHQLLACGVICQRTSVLWVSDSHAALSESCLPCGNRELSALSDVGVQPNLFHAVPASRRSNADNWEVFLTGTRVNSSLPAISLLIRLYAMGYMILVLMLLFIFRVAICGLSFVQGQKGASWFRQREWSSVCRVLSCVSRYRLATTLHTVDKETMIRLAHRELASCHVFIRLFAPVGRCLVRSAALCAYLMAIGLPAQLVIGRAQFSLSPSFDFHAWVEIAGTVVNDLEELTTGYTVLQRVP